VSLFIRPGPLVDQRLRSLFSAHDRYFRQRLRGNELSIGQQRVLSYLVKSQEINAHLDFTILLTQDNNHFEEIDRLAKAGLIKLHPKSPKLRPVYNVDPILSSVDYTDQLRGLFGEAFDKLDQTSKEVVAAIYRYNNFSSIAYPGARLLATTWWDEHGEDRGDVRRFDAFDRNVRLRMRRLEKDGFVVREGGSPRRPGYKLNEQFKSPALPGMSQ
jgi:hypothetical protein